MTDTSIIDEHLNIISWNISGLTDPNRKLIAWTYLLSLKHPIHILMLQELKVEQFCLDLALQLLLPGYHNIVAYPWDGRGGSALITDLDFTIRDYGTIPKGSIA